MSYLIQLENNIKESIVQKINKERVTRGLKVLNNEKRDEIVIQRLYMIYAIANEESQQILNTKIAGFNKLMGVNSKMYDYTRILFAIEIKTWILYNSLILKKGYSESMAFYEAMMLLKSKMNR